MNSLKKNLLYGKRLIVLIFVMSMLFSTLGSTAFAIAEEQTTVRIGYMEDYSGFINKQTDGTYTGYGAEYLYEISKYTGYQYEFISGNWKDLVEKLKKKEIDFLCTAQKTEERINLFDFSEYPIGYTQGLLYASEDSDICYKDFDSVDGATVGLLSGSAMNEMFKKFAEINRFSYIPVEFDSETEQMKALEAGDISFICSEHLASHTELTLVAEYGADAYYMMSYKDSPYIDGVNFALQQIKVNVDFENGLYHKYYDSSAAENKLQLTTEEHDYIEGCAVLKVGLMQHRSPLSYTDENGNAAGMMVDLMNLIAQKTGLQFIYEFMDVAQTGYDYLQSGGDLVAGVASSEFSSPNPELLQSDTLQACSIVFVGRVGCSFSEDAELTVAIPAGFINGEKVVSEKYPNFKYYNGVSNDDCLQAIRDGKADIMLQNMYVIRECLQSPLYDELAIFPAYAFNENEKILMLQENTVLLNIINKAIALISDKEANDVVIEHTIAKSYHVGVGELAYKYRLPLIGIGILLLMVVVLLIIITSIRQHNLRAVEKVNARLEKSNIQLSDAVIQADHANHAKSQFLSRMSHEIRTPMNAILGLTTIAKNHEDNVEKIDDYLNKIETSSKVLLNIINDVLDMSAIESEKLKIAHERFDIRSILTGISTLYYSQCEAKGIRFIMNTDLSNETFCGDSMRINQILMNLVSNAYKFTDKGGIIRIDTKEKEQIENTAFVRFTVSDTGSGMTDEMKERLFQPFEQETAATAQKHGGSGLGLSIAKNLVEMMHGAIAVESQKGVGTTFTVDIPLEIVEEQHQIASEHLKNIKILVVDDDETSLEYTSIVLGRIGAPSETVNTGAKALEMIERAENSGHPYDAIIIDWKMPDMNGIELTKKIRKVEKVRTMVIIASAYDLNQVEEEAKTAGVDHFVSKPLFQSTVFDTLMTLSGGKLLRDTATVNDYDFSGHKVLLAEDVDLNAEIEVELLDLVHLPCDRAVNGKQAVEMFNGSVPGTYDAILMDIQMPEMDGYEATKAIRALPRPDAKSIPILAMTANAFTEDVSMAFSAGMNGHIAKPIDNKALYQKLKEVFEKKENKA